MLTREDDKHGIALRFADAMSDLLARSPVTRVVFAGDRTQPPALSYMVTFPRVELPISGEYRTELEIRGERRTMMLGPGQALVVPPNCWNKPAWDRPTQVMSLLFGKKQLGISMVACDGRESALRAEKFALHRPIYGPGQKILEAVLELGQQATGFPSMPALIAALVQCCEQLLRKAPWDAASRSRTLLESICVYLQEHYGYQVTRDSVAAAFSVSPNHLSRLFQQQGSMKFSDYLTHVRVDRAKFLLARYDVDLTTIAEQCGFGCSAYFCRVFKRQTKKTPTQYRREARGGAAGQRAGVGER